MVIAVIPACNEAHTIRRVIRSALAAGAERVLAVVNGSTDGTLAQILSLREPGVTAVHFPQRLGIDVPRAAGAWFAAAQHADICLFVDGDMAGDIAPGLAGLIAAVQGGLDMALTDCYPQPPPAQGLAKDVLRFRAKLNAALGLAPAIGVAIPSHGPHAVSQRFLSAASLADIAIPPAAMAAAVRGGLSVGIGAVIGHPDLGSPNKQFPHSRKVADTIIGDCIEGICVACGLPRRRVWEEQAFLGYHPERRFDLLREMVSQINTGLYTQVRCFAP